MAGLPIPLRKMPRHLIWWLIAITALPYACRRKQHTENEIIFRDWYIVKPVAAVSASVAYGSIENTGRTPHLLTAAQLDCADKTLLHETLETAGRISMVHRESIPLPGGEETLFEPAHKHLMISGLKTGIDQCEIAFTIDGKPMRFKIPVKEREK